MWSRALTGIVSAKILVPLFLSISAYISASAGSRRLLRQGFQSIEDPVRSGIDADWRDVAPAHDPLVVQDEQRALRGAVGTAVDSIAARDRPFGLEIRQQRELQLAVADEGEVTPDAIHRDAQQLGTKAPKLWQHFVIERHLVAADWAPVRGVEGE